MSDPTFTYVLPVHNQAAVLARTVHLLAERLRHLPGSEIILVENGSTDGSGALCLEMATLHGDAGMPVRATTSAKGLGFAWQRGMHLARGEVIVLTAADLPFGFTDLDGYLALQPRPALVMGSKSHPDSVIEAPALRRSMSSAFALLRRALTGIDLDTQGAVFIDAQLAQRLAPRLRCGDFLIGTEINCWAKREGVEIAEVPVVYAAARESTVSPLRDSARMARGLLALRWRLDADRRRRHAPGEALGL